MGMGLAISQTIVENPFPRDHPGRADGDGAADQQTIAIPHDEDVFGPKSELGQGSAFHLTLPLSEIAADTEIDVPESLETFG